MSGKKIVLATMAAISMTSAVQPAFANKEGVGTVLGGIIGGLLGNATGDSEVSRRNGTIIGALIGGFLGNRIGASMDEADKRAYADAQRRALESRIGETIEWEGSDYGGRTGAQGEVTTTDDGYHKRTGEYCRRYRSDFRVNGRSDSTVASACLKRSGQWYDVKESDINWNTVSNDGGLPGADGSMENSQSFIGGTLVNTITRKSGGEWIRIRLSNASILERLHLEVRDNNLKIHQIIVVTRQGHKVPINFAGTNAIFNRGSTKSLDLRSIGVSTGYIDIRAESYGGIASMKVLLEDIHGDEVRSKAERF